VTARVFVVEDDDDVRRSLHRLLTGLGFDVRSYASATEFLDEAPGPGPACLLVDYRLPDGNGLDVQRAIRTRGETFGVVFLTGHADVPTSVKAMKAGATDFLTKPVDADALKTAVDRALAESAQDYARRLELDAFRTRLSSLTPREHEVCALVVEGLLNKQIGDRLGTSEKTIKVHRARAMKKLGVGSVAELARLAERTSALRR
jgi:FixJ family two-component response regulator